MERSKIETFPHLGEKVPMVLSYITNMISFDQPPQHNDGGDIDEELTLPIQMPASLSPASATAPKHHIISIMDFMKHSRHIQEHRISIPNTSKL
jgi:hypothetical protein